MKIPKRLKVGGHTYKVNDNYRFKERSDRRGHSDYAMTEIVISPLDAMGKRMNTTAIEETFIHEMLHCIDDAYNAGGLSEEQITRMSQGLYQVLKDNNMLK